MICCHCGEFSDQYICKGCLACGVAQVEVFPTFSEQSHKIGNDSKRYRHKSGAGILFTDGHSILLLKRKKPSDNAGTWGIPGGGSKKGESPIATAWRETKEECGVEPQGYQIQKFHEKDGRHNFHVFIYMVRKLFECEVSKEHSEAKWIPIKNLGEYKLHPKMAEHWPVYKRAIDYKIPKKSFSEWLASKNLLDIQK